MSFKRQACKTILVHYAPNFQQNVWQLIASHRKMQKNMKIWNIDGARSGKCKKYAIFYVTCVHN